MGPELFKLSLGLVSNSPHPVRDSRDSRASLADAVLSTGQFSLGFGGTGSSIVGCSLLCFNHALQSLYMGF